MHLVYCDYIAHIISCFIKGHDAQRLIHSVGRVESKLDVDGSYVGPDKTVMVTDCNGTKYKVTVTLIKEGEQQ